MPLNFNPYQSTYVDPGSVKISETLRTRFADNFAADDTLAQAVSEMISLTPDEGAKALLEEKYRGIMDERASKGDYENMGMQIVRDARKFKTEYDPIAEQAAARQRIVDDLKKRRDSSDITSGMYDSAMAEMDNAYAATGGVSEGGSYQERSVSNFVNVNERIFERIKALKPDAIGGFEKNYIGLDGQQVAELGAAGQLGVGYDPEARYSYTTKQGTREYVPAQDIQDAFTAVMNEPDVREFMMQQARYDVNSMSDEGVSAAASRLAALYRADADASDDADVKAGLNEKARKMEEQIANAETDPRILRGLAMDATYYNNLDPLRKAAFAIPGEKNVGGSSMLDWDKKWLKFAEDNSVIPFGAGTTGGLQHLHSQSGTTLAGKNAYRASKQNLINQMQAPDYYAETLPGITFDQLRDMSEADFKAMRPTASPGELQLFRQQKNQQLEVLGELAAIDRVMNEAYKSSGETEEKRLKDSLNVTGASDAVKLIQQAVPGVDETTALELLRGHGLRVQRTQVGSLAGGHTVQANMDISHLDPEIMAKVQKVLGGFGALTGGIDYGEANGIKVNDILRGINNAMKESDDKINLYLEGVTQRTFTPTLYTTVPDMTKKGRAEIDRMYKDSSPAERAETFVSPTTGQLVGFDELLVHSGIADSFKDGSDGQEMMHNAKQIGQVLFNPANVGIGGGTLTVSYQIDMGSEGKKIVETQIPFTHTDIPSIKTYMSGTSYQFLRQASTQRNHGIEAPMVTVLTLEGERELYKVNFDNKTVVPMQGPREGIPQDLDSALSDNGFITALAGSGDRIVAN
jgi:hypothetical protein